MSYCGAIILMLSSQRGQLALEHITVDKITMYQGQWSTWDPEMEHSGLGGEPEVPWEARYNDSPAGMEWNLSASCLSAQYLILHEVSGWPSLGSYYLPSHLAAANKQTTHHRNNCLSERMQRWKKKVIVWHNSQPDSLLHKGKELGLGLSPE